MTAGNQSTETKPRNRFWSLLLYVLISIGAGLLLGTYRRWMKLGIAEKGAMEISFNVNNIILPGTFVLTVVVIFWVIVHWRLGGQLVSPSHLSWIEWVTLAVVVLVVASLPALVAGSPSKPEPGAYVEVPVPASDVVGGTQGLVAGWPIEIVAVVPNADMTPTPIVFSDVEIRAFLGGSRDGSEPGTVLVAVPTDQAMTLQMALVSDGAKLFYRLLEAKPTATPTTFQTPTVAPTPLPTSRPQASKVFVELDVDKIKQRASSLQKGSAILIVVEPVSPSVDESKNTVPGYISRDTIDVDVVAFLDTAGIQSDTFNEDTTRVLLEIDQKSLGEYARSMAAATDIWLTNK
ncbi:MAG: hypothetical protein H6649_02270 [Caldilineae bacterium]|nr:hypothetical protein [Anaerolineae bacterium]MCB9152867.1 hypothetical protein [Caldilineae bacterium]